jgi:hypothetical protein
MATAPVTTTVSCRTTWAWSRGTTASEARLAAARRGKGRIEA